MLSDLAALYAGDPALFAGSVFMLGLVVGSFLNVVIYRLPIILEREWAAQAAEFPREPSIAPTSQAAAAPFAAPQAAGAPSAAAATTAAAIAAAAAPATAAATPAVGPAAASASAASTAYAPPHERFTLSTPRSACPRCKTPIKAWQNIPIVSWLLLRGRCAACNTRISIRYPLVELSTAVLSAWVAWHFGFGVAAACALGVTWTLIALAGIDIDHQLLPDQITLPLLWAGLLAAVSVGPAAGRSLPVAAHDAILGAAAGYLSLWLVFHAFRLVTGKEGMGYGDFKLFGALGAWLGWKVLPVIILLSAATGAVLGIAMIVLKGRDRAAPMPFGPYLAAAGWLAMMYGDSLVSGYLRLSGLRH